MESPGAVLRFVGNRCGSLWPGDDEVGQTPPQIRVIEVGAGRSHGDAAKCRALFKVELAADLQSGLDLALPQIRDSKICPGWKHDREFSLRFGRSLPRELGQPFAGRLGQ